MIRLLLIDLIITYFLAVTMYIIYDRINPSDEQRTFIKNNDFEGCTKGEIVIRCMYYIMTTLTTMGFGDYLAYSSYERVVSLIFEMFGVALYSYIMGNFLEIMQSYDKKFGSTDKSAEFQIWFALLDRFNNGRRIDNAIEAEIEDFYIYFWDEYKLSDLTKDDSNLVCLPTKIQREVFYSRIIAYHKFFTLGVNIQIPRIFWC